MFKIVILGPESTGKSTLTSQLAEHYKAQWVPEYARQYIDMLDRPDGWLTQLSKEQPSTERVDELVTAAYHRTVSRKPTESELADCRQHIEGSENIIEGVRDLMWALLNTQEFIANH